MDVVKNEVKRGDFRLGYSLPCNQGCEAEGRSRHDLEDGVTHPEAAGHPAILESCLISARMLSIIGDLIRCVSGT